MRLQTLTVGLLLLLATASCTKENRCVRGSSDIATETTDLTTFEGVDFRLPGVVQIVKGTEYSVTVKASDNHIGLIRTQVRGNKLVIDTDNRCLKNTKIQITVTTPELSFLRVAGSGDIFSADNFTAANWELRVDGSGSIEANTFGGEVDANISGSGDIALRGTVENFSPTISGSGSIKAFALVAEEVSARISGSGNIQTTAAEKLNVTISGSGNVRYKGSPASVNTTISGSGKLIKAD